MSFTPVHTGPLALYVACVWRVGYGVWCVMGDGWFFVSGAPPTPHTPLAHFRHTKECDVTAGASSDPCPGIRRLAFTCTRAAANERMSNQLIGLYSIDYPVRRICVSVPVNTHSLPISHHNIAPPFRPEPRSVGAFPVRSRECRLRFWPVCETPIPMASASF